MSDQDELDSPVHNRSIDEHLREQTLKSELIYPGKIIRVEKLTVGLPNGREANREVVRHSGAVAVLAEPTPNHILLVRQFRKAPDTILLEVPAGKLEPNELPELCASRELAEETGYVANELHPVFEFFTSPGFADEKIWLFYASNLTPGDTHPDEDEFVEVSHVHRDDVQKMLRNGEFTDAKTLVAVLWWLYGKETEPVPGEGI